jgi:hypothetical protein
MVDIELTGNGTETGIVVVMVLLLETILSNGCVLSLTDELDESNDNLLTADCALMTTAPLDDVSVSATDMLVV